MCHSNRKAVYTFNPFEFGALFFLPTLFLIHIVCIFPIHHHTLIHCGFFFPLLFFCSIRRCRTLLFKVDQKLCFEWFFLPFSKVCSASDGSQCRQSSPKRRKLFPCPSSWPSTGKTNCDENVLLSKSVIFRNTSSRWVSMFRLIECAKASLKINYANYNCVYGSQT